MSRAAADRSNARARALRRVVALTCTGALLAAASPLALALKADRQAPMEIRAETGDAMLAGDGDVRLQGNVAIQQGSFLAEAATAVISRKAGGLDRAVLDGQPARLQQQLDEGGLLRARARRIDYDLKTETVVLSGDVEVQQPRGTLRGERITYDLKTGRLDAGGGEGGRIFMRIEPTSTSGS